MLKEKVYIRRGSSTDPTKPASIEEIAQMRVGMAQDNAEMQIAFSHLERDDILGTKLSWDAEYCEMPPQNTIPKLSPPDQQGLFGYSLSSFDLTCNRNFFRELAEFEFVRRLFKPVRLVVMNCGKVVAKNVRIEIIVPLDIGAIVIDSSGLPKRPQQRENILNNISPKDIISSSYRCYPGEVDIVNNSERFRIDIKCEDLQPGRKVWSDVFYIGKKSSGDIPFSGMIFADNLPQPKEFVLSVAVNITVTSMSVHELCALESNKGRP